MQQYTAVIEKCNETGLYVGYVPGFPGAHSQGTSLAELADNLHEVLDMLTDHQVPHLESEFVGTFNLVV